MRVRAVRHTGLGQACPSGCMAGMMMGNPVDILNNMGAYANNKTKSPPCAPFDPACCGAIANLTCIAGHPELSDDCCAVVPESPTWDPSTGLPSKTSSGAPNLYTGSQGNGNMPAWDSTGATQYTVGDMVHDTCGQIWAYMGGGVWQNMHQVVIGAGKVGTTGCVGPMGTTNMDPNWMTNITNASAPWFTQPQPGTTTPTTPTGNALQAPTTSASAPGVTPTSIAAGQNSTAGPSMPGAPPATQIISGVDNSTLLLGGAAAVALLFLFK